MSVGLSNLIQNFLCLCYDLRSDPVAGNHAYLIFHLSNPSFLPAVQESVLY